MENRNNNNNNNANVNSSYESENKSSQASSAVRNKYYSKLQKEGILKLSFTGNLAKQTANNNSDKGNEYKKTEETYAEQNKISNVNFKEEEDAVEDSEEIAASKNDFDFRIPISIKNPPTTYTYAKELEGVPRVNEFVYRGMKRSPEVLKEGGGIWCILTAPNIPEHKKRYGVSFSALEQHIDDNEGAFISTTRSIKVAVYYAVHEATKAGLDYGYVYCMRAHGGIDATKIVLSRHGFEQEVSVPGGIDYENIVAYRKVSVATGGFFGPVRFLASDLQNNKIDKETVKRIHNDLSGTPQPIDEKLTQRYEDQDLMFGVV